jgi:hypothetical protein
VEKRPNHRKRKTKGKKKVHKSHLDKTSSTMLKLKQLQQQKQAAQQAKAVEQEAAAAATNGGDAAATEPATNGETKSTSTTPHAAASLMAKYKASSGKKEEGVMSLSKAGGRNKKRQNAVELRVQKGSHALHVPQPHVLLIFDFFY